MALHGALTCLFFVSCFVQVKFPNLVLHGSLLGLAINLLWLWGEKL